MRFLYEPGLISDGVHLADYASFSLLFPVLRLCSEI